MKTETAIETLARIGRMLKESGAEEVSKATDRAVRAIARSCGILITKPSSKARVYSDGYMSMSSIGVALECPFPQWRNVQKALMQMGYLKREKGLAQPSLTSEGKAWGRVHDEDGKRWRVWKPEIVEHIRPVVARLNEAYFEDSE